MTKIDTYKMIEEIDKYESMTLGDAIRKRLEDNLNLYLDQLNHAYNYLDKDKEQTMKEFSKKCK